MGLFDKMFGRASKLDSGVAFTDGTVVSYQGFGEMCPQLAGSGMKATYDAILASEILGQPSLVARIRLAPRPLENLLFVQFCAANLVALSIALGAPAEGTQAAIDGFRLGLNPLAARGSIPNDPAYLYNFHRLILTHAAAMQGDFNASRAPGTLDLTGGRAAALALSSLQDAYRDDGEESLRFNDLEELMLIEHLRAIPGAVAQALAQHALRIG